LLSSFARKAARAKSKGGVLKRADFCAWEIELRAEREKLPTLSR
jgi:hypothetical protein